MARIGSRYRRTPPRIGFGRAAMISLAAAGLFCLAPAPTASAATLSYAFTPDASTILGGYTQNISGSFDYDTSTDKVSSVALSLSGPGPYAGSYSVTGWSTGTEFYVSQPGGPYTLEFLFGASLAGKSAPIAEVIENWKDSGGNWKYVSDGAPTGGVVDPLKFVFSSDAATVLGGNTEAISGYFLYDPATQKVLSSYITLTGGGPYAGLYSVTGWSTAGEVYVSQAGGPYMLEFLFSPDLNNSTAGIGEVIENWKDSAGNWKYVSDASPTGTVVDPPIPEPASLVLLGTALGLGLLAKRRRRV